ncbi:MAG TPA: LysR substrate-binding domain-containing protein [Segetibacter sp.]|jgi:LysR family hydrogen peroxide-inducible transcriptional activator
MNLQQLEYIVAVDKHRNFGRAAASKFVTQPTLSAMIQKLEDELAIQIFNRKKFPVEPTTEGVRIVEHAKLVLQQAAQLLTYAKEVKGEIAGDLRLGIIPTLAPYLLPLFLKPFAEQYPLLQIFIKEMVTEDIMAQLKSGELDMGLLVTPLDDNMLKEYPLFYEEFYAYAAKSEKLGNKKYILPKDINIDHLWLLEEGHCFRNQIFNLCELKKEQVTSNNLHYEAGSIETLINLVDRHEGITIIPHFATLNLNAEQKKNIRAFAEQPVREISLVVNHTYPREKLLKQVQEAIKKALPFDESSKSSNIIHIN